MIREHAVRLMKAVGMSRLQIEQMCAEKPEIDDSLVISSVEIMCAEANVQRNRDIESVVQKLTGLKKLNTL